MQRLPYTRHHKPLLITSHSWIQAIFKDRIFWKNLLKNKETDFENGVKNIQARTVLVFNYKSAYYIQQKLKNQVNNSMNF